MLSCPHATSQTHSSEEIDFGTRGMEATENNGSEKKIHATQ